jgi:adenine-specific DNA-methyltransferase
MRALHNPGKEGYRYDLPHPNGQPVVQPLRGYRYPESRMAELVEQGRIIFGADERELAKLKVYLADADVSLRGVIDLDSRTATREVARLFPENPDVFKNPKPVAIEEYLLSFVARSDALILDCFAGSGSTGHAVMRLNAKDGGQRRFILIEEGNGGDRYATTLTAERLRRARTMENLPGGFSFRRVDQQIDTANLATLQRRQLVEVILQTDASGKGGGVKPVSDGKFVIGRNARREALCLHFDPQGHTPITGDILTKMYAEADALKLNRPLRVYGEACQIFGSDSFRFFKLPDEVTNNLTVALRGVR